MTKQQSTVIWIGLIIVALNVFINLADLKGLLFGKVATTAKTQSNTPAGNPVQGVQSSGGMSTPANNQVQAV